jgi:hypothetical protein
MRTKRTRGGRIRQDYYPFFFSIKTDSDDRIFFIRNDTSKMIPGYGPTENGDEEADVFNLDGTFLFETRLPRNCCVIDDRFIYAYDLNDETGDE